MFPNLPDQSSEQFPDLPTPTAEVTTAEGVNVPALSLEELYDLAQFLVGEVATIQAENAAIRDNLRARQLWIDGRG